MSKLTDVNRSRFLQTTVVGATVLAAGGSELIQATQAHPVPPALSAGMGRRNRRSSISVFRPR
jgi:hypothetical protein